MESVLGEAWVSIQANLEPAMKQISAYFDKVANTELIVKTRADISQVVRSYDQVKKMAADARPIINVTANVGSVEAEMTGVDTLIRDSRPMLVVGADTAPAMTAIERMRAAARAAITTTVTAVGTVGSRSASAGTAEAEAGGASGRLGSSSMVGQLKGFAEILGVLEGIHGIASAARDTQEFQTRLVDLSTGAGEATKNLGMISAGLLSMSTQVGVSAVELEKGLYFIESDGAHGAAALNVLKASAMGARTGLADMEDVTVGLMTVMRSYEIPFSKATQVTSALVEAVAHGGVRLTDFSQAMKTVAPVAAAFNVPLTQVLGAMSTITSITHNAAQGATGLRFLLNTLAAPSNTAAGAMSQIGLQAIQVQRALHDQGLLGALKLIETHLGQTFPGDAVRANAVLHDIFGGTRGMSAGLELTNQHLNEMIANIGDITTKSGEAGDSVAGWDKITKTLSYNVDVMRAGLVRFGIQAGTFVLPAVTALLRGIISLASGIGTTLGAAIDLVRPEWAAFAKGFNASPGEQLGGGLLGWLAKVGQTVHTVATDAGATWGALINGISGKQPTGAQTRGLAGRVSSAIGGARSLISDFTGGLRSGDTTATITSDAIRIPGAGAAGVLAGRQQPNLVSAGRRGIAGVATALGAGLNLFGKGFGGKVDTSAFVGWQRVVVEAGTIGKRAFDDVKTAVGGMVTGVKAAVTWGLKHKTLLGDIAIGIGVVVAAMKAYELVTAAVRVATEAWTMAQALLNGTMEANPIGLIVVGIGLLVGGLIYAYQKVGWFRDGVNAAFSFVAKAGKEAWSLISDGISAFVNGPLKWIEEQVGKFTELWHEKHDQIMQLWSELWTFVSTVFKIYWDVLSGELKIALEWLGIAWHAAWDLVKNDFTLVWGLIRDILTFGINFIKNTLVLFIDLFTGKWGKLWGDVKILVGQAFGDVAKIFVDFGKNAITMLYQAGKDVIGGLIKGVTDAGKTVWNTVKNVADDIINGVKHFFGIHSPSTVMAGLGGHIITGLIKGILETGGGMGGILDQIFKGALSDPWGWLTGHLADLGSILEKVPGLAAGLAKKAVSGAVHGLEHLGSGILGAIFGGGGGGDKVNGLIAESLAINGLPSSWAGAMAQLIAKESGGNASAVNPTKIHGESAHGIAQMMPSTFAKYELPGFTDIMDGLANLLASERYIKARYGSPDRIPNLFNGGYVGYDSGGLLPPGQSLVINRTGTGEPTAVFTPQQWATLQALASGTSGGGNVMVHNTVYLGDREITDIVREEATVVVDKANKSNARALSGGVKRR